VQKSARKERVVFIEPADIVCQLLSISEAQLSILLYLWEISFSLVEYSYKWFFRIELTSPLVPGRLTVIIFQIISRSIPKYL